MLADKIKSIIEDQAKSEQALINSLDKKAKQDLYEKINKVVKVINEIKSNVQLISESKKKIVMDSYKNIIKVTDMKEIFGSSTPYDKYIYSNKNDSIDFIKFFSSKKELPLYEKLESFKNWMENEGIESIIIKNEHDGGGVSSWNSYWIKLKN
jgi:hypothetical protein